MSEIKQVKVDNWGIFFLQRLKHFFNRTDYCDLTLQFQDNAQLKVHRLVLNACTEYFEILERTCEMYEDCLIMPDDLQTDVMVPIVNFMYTGQLEYRNEMLDKLYQTSQIMNMTVLTKLLDAQRHQVQETKQQSNSNFIRTKRSYTKAFNSKSSHTPQKKVYVPARNSLPAQSVKIRAPLITTMPAPQTSVSSTSRFKKKSVIFDKRPTRYNLPEELDTDNVFDDSFRNISYDSKPLMVHPETKQYTRKPSYGLFSEASSSKKFEDIIKSSIDIECKRVSSKNNENLFEDEIDSFITDSDIFETNTTVYKSYMKDSNQLFDQILDNGPKLTIETKDKKEGTGNLDHAKIISEVLKKYPHLVKSNKNIRLKILDAPTKMSITKTGNKRRNIEKQNTPKDEHEYTFESDVMDSKEAARLVSLGADNVKGPWICLICGTPGRALHFTSYYKFRRHLVEVHNERPIVNNCEYCGIKCTKKNYFFHHMYTKHGVEPPPTHNFPKCNQCNYVALTEAFLVRHKISHADFKDFRCNVCFNTFKSSHLLLNHIQITGHKFCGDKRPNQCIYCLKVFLRETNLYTHLKACHKEEARNDGIVDYSDDEEENVTTKYKVTKQKIVPIKYEYDNEDMDVQYQIQQNSDGNIQVLTKKTVRHLTSPKKKPNQKILNQDFNTRSTNKVRSRNLNTEFNDNEEMETELLDDDTQTEEMIIHENSFILKQPTSQNNDKLKSEQYILPEMIEEEASQTSSLQMSERGSNEFIGNISNDQTIIQQPNMIIKKTGNINQPIQIVVSNEEEYKALMSSNQSIIFDEHNTGKTLTVLTTPHTSSLNSTTTLDLNNPQTNEMMIIQENYPLNVSEAVTSDNSNIVVVYSHPVDENKQYLMNTHYAQPQLISSQTIETQFVPSSAVITQNYETITTSTPIVSGQVIVQQPVQSWQGDIQQDINHETVQLTDEQPYITVDSQAQLIPNVSEINTGNITEDNTLEDLPVIQMGQQDQETSLPIQSEQVHEMNEQIVNSAVIIAPNENIIETPVVKEQNTENVISDISIVETSEISAEQTIDEEDLTLLEKPNEDKIEIAEISGNTEHQNIDENISNNTHIPEIPETDIQLIENQETVDEPNDHNEGGACDIENNTNENIKIVSKEKIEILASEWSDGEEDHSPDGGNTDVEKPLCETPIEQQDAEDSTEIEESIENIQQEMEKQMKAPSEIVIEQDNVEEHEEIHDEPEEQVPLDETTNQKGNEKLSSLLNDWDENDSQSESLTTQNNIESPIESEQVVVVQHQEVNTEPITEEATIIPVENTTCKKDNIKKLVSDWDDDEEENKE